MSCVLDESGSDVAECHRKVESGRKVAGDIKFLVNASGVQPECAWVLQEALLVPVLLCDTETDMERKVGV